jgi:3-isopropylmalate/(R)-2-methylmalate dehydratase small subunit
MIISGTAIKLGDNINTDVIFPGKYMVLIEPNDLAQHAMEGLDPVFPKKIKDGAILVVGKNFGCGSSREQAPLSLKYAGIKCILAESFARIFYRNAINIGLPIVESKGVSDLVEEGDRLTVDLKEGTVKDESKSTSFHATQLPPFILEILLDGGLVENLRKKMR